MMWKTEATSYTRITAQWPLQTAFRQMTPSWRNVGTDFADGSALKL